MSSSCQVEPGASTETVFVTTDSCDNIEQMSSSLEEIKSSSSVFCPEDSENSNKDNLDDSAQLDVVDHDEDYIRNKDWLSKHKHIFVLSSAGKPVYSR